EKPVESAHGADSSHRPGRSMTGFEGRGAAGGSGPPASANRLGEEWSPQATKSQRFGFSNFERPPGNGTKLRSARRAWLRRRPSGHPQYSGRFANRVEG